MIRVKFKNCFNHGIYMYSVCPRSQIYIVTNFIKSSKLLGQTVLVAKSTNFILYCALHISLVRSDISNQFLVIYRPIAGIKPTPKFEICRHHRAQRKQIYISQCVQIKCFYSAQSICCAKFCYILCVQKVLLHNREHRNRAQIKTMC